MVQGVELWQYVIFWPRAMLKGPKRSFVVVVVLILVVLGVKSWAKSFPREQNLSCKSNEAHKVPIAMEAKCYLLWHITVINYSVCLGWPHVALNEWPFVASVWSYWFSRPWPCVSLFDFIWSCFCFVDWILEVHNGLVWPFLALFDTLCILAGHVAVCYEYLNFSISYLNIPMFYRIS